MDMVGTYSEHQGGKEDYMIDCCQPSEGGVTTAAGENHDAGLACRLAFGIARRYNPIAMATNAKPAADERIGIVHSDFD